MRQNVPARAVAALPVLVSVGVLVLVAVIARRGLDVVDESYLLRVIADPQSTRPAGEVYLFGFVLHPVYLLVGRDVAVFRLVGFGVVALLAAFLCRESLAVVRDAGTAVSRAQEWAALSTAAASSMLVFSFNVTIPAYRSVTLVGLMLAAVGLARLGRGFPAVGGSLLGVGVWIAFVGKPTSALALVLVALPLLQANRLLSARMVLPAVLTGAAGAGLTLLAAGMWPVDAVDYLRRGLHQSNLLGSHSSIAMLMGWGLPRIEGLLIFGPIVLLPFLLGWLLRRRLAVRIRSGVELGTATAVLVAGVGVALVAAQTLGPTGFGWQTLSLSLALPLLATALLVRGGWPRTEGGRSFTSWYVLVLLVLPWVSAVGSNVSFSVGMSLASVFWVVALTLVVQVRDERRPHGSRLLLTLGLVATLVATMTWVVHRDGLDGGDLGPGLVAAPVEGGQLLLRPEDAHTAKELRAASTEYGIREGTPVVDLTGVGAGYALMVGGRPIGRAHLYGYLPNSIGAAREALATASCQERATAWLIWAPDNSMDVSPALTGGTLSLTEDYETVLTFTSRQVRGTWDMRLLRPLPSVREKLGC